MTNSEANAEKDEVSTVAKRAFWESFEFAVPEQGAVVVENVSYGPESSEHVHPVNVEDGQAVSCGCKAYEFGDGRCKHMIAVDWEPAVIRAASPEIEIEVEEPVPLPNESSEETNAEAEEMDTATASTQAVATDGGQLTELKQGDAFIDAEGIAWTIDKPVEQTESGPCTRLVSENGGIRREDPREFVKAVNKEIGDFSVVSLATVDDERRTPRRSEPADYGGGSSTGVQDL